MEELNNSIPSRNENLIKAKGGTTNTDFIGSMPTAILLCFHRNVKIFHDQSPRKYGTGHGLNLQPLDLQSDLLKDCATGARYK